MLYLTIALSSEGWDEEKQEFVDPITQTLQLEHSLVSISKWESKWCKPFLSGKEMPTEEVLDYIKCMNLTPDVDPDVYNYLTRNHIDQVVDYIGAPMTATTINEDESKGKVGREIITSELIYYWMVALQIPFECQYWHLNRLITLVKVCNVKNQPPKKQNQQDVMRRNAALNAARRKKLNSRG